MGITLVYIYGAFLHWTYICYLSGAVAFFTSVVALVSLPESPIWLFIQGREEETVYILQKLRGMPANSKEIIEELKCMSDAKNMRASDESNIIHELTRPESYKPILLILAIFFLVNFSGAFAFLAYGVDLVKDFGFSEDIQYIPAIIVSSMRLIGTILGVFLFIPYFQRKTLMISTAVVMFLCHIGIALVSYLQNMSFVSESVAKWISLILMCAYLVTFGSGAGTIPWSLAGELTTMKVTIINLDWHWACCAYISNYQPFIASCQEKM